MGQPISIPQSVIEAFCRTHNVRRLALFGSALTEEFRPDSDVDMLVEFEPGTRIGLFGLTAMQIELSEMIGRRVDLNTPGFLAPSFREQVIRDAVVLYARG